uniref:Odorant binding protein 10 n=1 Tax=Cephus cinctus TaxID=211228 RepID=A0A1W6L1L1_CEPCN|nr:odorant binding protein 10 [Cephus cinctus]
MKALEGFSRILITFIVAVMVIVKADIRRDCRKQSGVSWAALKKLRAGDFNQEDHSVKCYLKCFMVKNGIMSEDNHVDVDKALRHLPRKLQEPSRKILARCKDSAGKDSCDKAFQIAKCYFKSQPGILKNVSFV